MNEIYRSYEGKLGVDNRHGFEVYELENMYEIHEISVYKSGPHKWRVSKELCKDYTDFEGMSEMELNTMYGNYNREDMQVWHNDKWWSGKKICSIIKKHGDTNWRKYAR